jgi:hypothetical protein
MVWTISGLFRPAADDAAFARMGMNDIGLKRLEPIDQSVICHPIAQGMN